jgi:hypothetical protein
VTVPCKPPAPPLEACCDPPPQEVSSGIARRTSRNLTPES